jgi:hypothetical protein
MCTSLVFARLGPSGLALLLAALVLLAAFVAQYAGARRAAARCATLQALAEPAAPLGIHAALADLNRAFGGSDVRFAHALGAALLDERGDPVRFAAAARRALFADLRPLIGTGREAARVVASAAPLLGTILAVAGLGGALRGGGRARSGGAVRRRRAVPRRCGRCPDPRARRHRRPALRLLRAARCAGRRRGAGAAAPPRPSFGSGSRARAPGEQRRLP